jgi:hypothetical protein
MHVMVKHLDSNVKNGLRGAQKTGWASSYVTTPGKTSNKALEMVFFSDGGFHEKNMFK